MSGGLVDIRWGWDEALFASLNGLRWDWLDALFVAASSREFGVLGLALLLGWLAVAHRRRAPVPILLVAASVGVTDALGARLLKPWVGRLRPSHALAEEAVRVLSPASNSGSMPSLHAANAFAVATAVTLLLPRAGWVAFPFATLIALSRVGVGVHWPSDVLVGAATGAAIGLLLVRLARRWWRPANDGSAEARRPSAPST